MSLVSSKKKVLKFRVGLEVQGWFWSPGFWKEVQGLVGSSGFVPCPRVSTVPGLDEFWVGGTFSGSSRWKFTCWSSLVGMEVQGLV